MRVQVSVQTDGEHSCGGVVVSAEFILTAAHCVRDQQAGSLTAVAGAHQARLTSCVCCYHLNPVLPLCS